MVEEIVEHSPSDRPALPPASAAIASPATGCTNVLATVAGNLFDLAESPLQLLDITFPAELAASCPGPAVDVAGTRRLAGLVLGLAEQAGWDRALKSEGPTKAFLWYCMAGRKPS